MHRVCQILPYVLWQLTTFLCLVSCSSSDIQQEGEEPDNTHSPVRFSATGSEDWNDLSRSGEEATTPFDKGDKIGVFAYYNESSTPDFMNNQEVQYNGTAWSYSPVKYWPANANDKLSFYAYYPYDAENSQIKVSNDEEGRPTVTYDNVKADVDWMTAKASGQTYAQNKESIRFTFNHLLARVKFKFTVEGETNYRPVVHILKYNVPHYRGTLLLKGYNTFDYTAACDGDSVQLTRYVKNAAGEIISSAGKTIDEFTAYLFPCKFPCTDDVETLGAFTISLNNIEYTYHPGDFIPVEAGKSYTVNFKVKATNGSTNFFITSYSIWEDGGEYEGKIE